MDELQKKQHRLVEENKSRDTSPARNPDAIIEDNKKLIMEKLQELDIIRIKERELN